MVRLSQQVKAGPKSTKYIFFHIVAVMFYVFICFGHNKANLIKHDLGRLGRLFSEQFEELKQRCFQKRITLNSF